MDETSAIDGSAAVQAYLNGHGGIKGRHVRRTFKGEMEMTVTIQALRKGTTEEQELQTDAGGAQALLTTLGQAPYGALAAARSIFCGNSLAGTAIAPEVAPPTTSPAWMLWNGEGVGGKSYVLLECAAVLISGVAGLGLSLMGGVGLSAETVNPTNYSGAVIGSTSGGVGSKARIGQNVTLLSTPAYNILKTADQTSSNGVGNGVEANLEGKYVVPPGFAFALEVVGETGTTALFAVSFLWAEIQLDLG